MDMRCSISFALFLCEADRIRSHSGRRCSDAIFVVDGFFMGN